MKLSALESKAKFKSNGVEGFHFFFQTILNMNRIRCLYHDRRYCRFNVNILYGA